MTSTAPQRFATGTLGRVVDEAAAELAAAGVDTARLDARLLAAHVLGRDSAFAVTHPETPLKAEQEKAVAALVKRRAAREPLSLILGEKEFWSLPFKVTRDTLTPRPDTETLVEEVLAWVDAAGRRAAPLTVLDLGTGTGCLLLALLSELPGATGLGIDQSGDALAVAAENAHRLGLAGRARFALGNWGRGLVVPKNGAGRFDVIVSNPPYIAVGDRAILAPEVRDHDPPAALFAGRDGLDAYAAMAPDMARLLAPGGALVVELGAGQEAAVAALFESAGLRRAATRADLAGIPRALRMGASGPL